MAVSYCFFDLDGTLVDSSAGIINSINYALDKMALPPFRAEEVTYFIGPPLATAFSSRRGLSPEDTQRAVNYYREHYRTDGIFACSVYGGIRELFVLIRREIARTDRVAVNECLAGQHTGGKLLRRHFEREYANVFL